MAFETFLISGTVFFRPAILFKTLIYTKSIAGLIVLESSQGAHLFLIVIVIYKFNVSF